VLAPDLAQELSAERFEREIRLSARLQHPNVVPILSAGVAGGVPYYTMPYVDGESLRARLARGRIPIADAISLLRDVARALAHAHARGIVHRDIKPENVLLSDDAVVVADFGIAKAVDAARTQNAAGGVTLTQLGATLGTPAYMAPEQAAGDPDVDHRADEYAWGVVAYEVLSGSHPFAGKRTAHALITAHMAELPTPLAQFRSDIPAALAHLVTRCLAKDPADRPASARELVDVLGALPHGALATPSVRPSLAVLPMVNTSGDSENEHFSDGLTDELIGALSKLESLRVTGRTSSFALKNLGLGIRAIGEKLGVTSVLEGSVRRAGRRLKVSTQLIKVSDDAVLWAETYDRELSDIFAVQEEIARSIVDALRIRLGESSDANTRLAEPAPASLEAYDLFLKGRFVSRRLTPDDFASGIRHFEEAIARDSAYARAYAALAHGYIMQAVFAALPTSQFVERARASALTAVRLDPNLADAHWALGHVLFAMDLELQAGAREFQHALALDPGHVEARHLHAIILLDLGQFDEAISELTRTLAADPLHAAAAMTLGRVYLSMGQLDQAIRQLCNALELSPGFSYARGHLAHAYLMQGKTDQAIAEFERAVTTGATSDLAQLAYAYAVIGRRAEAMATVQALLASERERYLPPFHMAMAYVGLGEIDESFRWLERAANERDPHVLGLNIVPAFRSLRGDKRFETLVRRLRLGSTHQ
jgi:serine/threonine-protein kinase